MWSYYFFFTLYMIPHNALIPELIQDGPLRVNIYTISSFFFVTGSNMRRCACANAFDIIPTYLPEPGTSYPTESPASRTDRSGTMHKL